MAKKSDPLVLLCRQEALTTALPRGWRRASPAKRLLVGALLCCFLPAVAARAAGPVAGQGAEPAKRPSLGKLLLLAKDPVTWKPIAGGAAGTLSYREQNGEFVFAAGGLAPSTGYALVRYGDLPDKADLLAEGKSDREGALRLAGVWTQWTKKIWLVLRADLARSGNQATATAWRPERYLFEEKELGIPCVCEEAP